MSITVVGGGVIGCAAALELARAGHRVTLLERGLVGREASWAAGGILTPVHLSDYPPPLAELCIAAQGLYPAFIDSLEAADLEFHTCGMLRLIFDDEDEDGGERISAAEARAREPWISPEVRGATWTPEVMQVRNSRLTRAIAAAAVRAGAEIRERTPVETVPEGRVIWATGAWAGPPVTPARGQMILVNGGKIRSALLWKDRYIIPRLDGRLLLGSTVEDVGFDTRTTDEGLRAIREDAIRMAPKVADLPVERTWAGLRPRTPDRLPIIGAEGRVIHATGHFRNGILLAPITARLVREIVEGRKPSIKLEPFAAGRFSAKH